MEDPTLSGEAFNFSNEQQITVLELVRKILFLMNSDLDPIILNEAPNEIPEQFLSAAKARGVLNWKALYSLESGLTRTIQWYREFFGELTKEPRDPLSERIGAFPPVARIVQEDQPTPERPRIR